MAAVIFASKLKKDGSITMPKEAIEAIGILPGDEVQVRVATKISSVSIEEHNQAMLQEKFERFLDRVDALHFEKPIKFSNCDQIEAKFAEVMDEKYRKLGFKH